MRWSRTERPPDIPSAPWRTYKNAGWNGLADWLGKKKRQKVVNAVWMIGRDGPYKEAKKGG